MRDTAWTRGGSQPLAVMCRAARWQPRSYPQIWAVAAAGYLACVAMFTAVLGGPGSGDVGFIGPASGFAAAAAGQSYRLHRRRTG
jgi:hypothetical protein